MVKTAKSRPQELSIEAETALIKKHFKMYTAFKPVKYWLNTGSSLLNGVFGSEEMGLAYGKMIELSGFESSGKSAEMYKLAGMAQKDGADVSIIDLENSWDPDWVSQRGLDPSKVMLFRPEIGRIGNSTKDVITPVEALFDMAQYWMERRHNRRPNGRMFFGVDSIAAALTDEEAAAGIQDQNMRTKVSLAAFLSALLRRWTVISTNWNVLTFFVNQLRTAPGAWGDPTYTPGGNAVRYYAAVRVRMYRKGKKILKGGKPIGIRGTLANWKNKVGGGSREGLKCAYKLYYDGRSKYLPVEEIKED